MLEWILDRYNNKVEAEVSAIGYLPKAADLDLTGLNLKPDALKQLLTVNKKAWRAELKDIEKFFKQFKQDLPEELWQEYNNLDKRLKS